MLAVCCVDVCCLLLLQYTPLLPAVAVGTMEEGSIVEPVRKILGSKVHKYLKTGYMHVCNVLAIIILTKRSVRKILGGKVRKQQLQKCM
jgi:NADH dehydrogenase FAD-containing subunit